MSNDRKKSDEDLEIMNVSGEHEMKDQLVYNRPTNLNNSQTPGKRYLGVEIKYGYSIF